MSEWRPLTGKLQTILQRNVWGQSTLYPLVEHCAKFLMLEILGSFLESDLTSNLLQWIQNKKCLQLCPSFRRGGEISLSSNLSPNKRKTPFFQSWQGEKEERDWWLVGRSALFLPFATLHLHLKRRALLPASHLSLSFFSPSQLPH